MYGIHDIEGVTVISGLIGFIISVFILIAVILILLLPFFIIRIRSETIAINKKLSKIIHLLSQANVSNKKDSQEEAGKDEFEILDSINIKNFSSEDKVKICPSCGSKNMLENKFCLKCHSSLA